MSGPLYILTSPDPVIPGTDAVFQEVSDLRGAFGGEVFNAFPLRRPTAWLPRALYGWHRIAALRELQHGADCLHVFYPFLYDFPFLRFADRPLVYTAVAGLAGQRRPSANLLGRAHVIVSNERDRAALREWGAERVSVIRPGIDLDRFVPKPSPPAGPFRLLVGSAPWTVGQFASKGIDALLRAAQARTDLELIFLWRGLHEERLRRKIDESGLRQRCEIVGGRADVPRLLDGVHAATVLAANSRLVKAHPHSLIEALAAGRPVLVSRAIAMSDDVAAAGCGTVAESLDDRELERALDELIARRGALATAARATAKRLYARAAMLAAHAEVYRLNPR